MEREIKDEIITIQPNNVKITLSAQMINLVSLYKKKKQLHIFKLVLF